MVVSGVPHLGQGASASLAPTATHATAAGPASDTLIPFHFAVICHATGATNLTAEIVGWVVVAGSTFRSAPQIVRILQSKRCACRGGGGCGSPVSLAVSAFAPSHAAIQTRHSGGQHAQP